MDGNRIVLGRVTGLFGVKGWCKVHSYTRPKENLLDYPQWWLRLEDDWRRLRIAGARRHGKTLIARLEGVEDRDAAAAWVGAEIAVGRDELPPAGEGEYYWADLEGLAVVNEAGDALGRVAYMIETGAHDVMVVAGGGRETLIPFAPGRTVREVDLEAGRIRVDWDWPA